MKSLVSFVYRLNLTFETVAGIVLALMMVVTVVDIVMRLLGNPIVGTIEIITFSGAIVVGFSLPATTWKRSHVFVDFLIEKLSPGGRKAMGSATRLLGVVLFLFIAYNFILYGAALKSSGEVSPSFGIPYYPLTYGLSFACLLQSLTLFIDIFRLWGEGEGK
jgi:TRAP-type C4-dicarboxylate transport system permease small subunit